MDNCHWGGKVVAQRSGRGSVSTGRSSGGGHASARPTLVARDHSASWGPVHSIHPISQSQDHPSSPPLFVREGHPRPCRARARAHQIPAPQDAPSHSAHSTPRTPTEFTLDNGTLRSVDNRHAWRKHQPINPAQRIPITPEVSMRRFMTRRSTARRPALHHGSSPAAELPHRRIAP